MTDLFPPSLDEMIADAEERLPAPGRRWPVETIESGLADRGHGSDREEIEGVRQCSIP
jgi:hypothetical protein